MVRKSLKSFPTLPLRSVPKGRPHPLGKRGQGCEWDYWTCSSAAKNGHLHVLKWARENGEEKFKTFSNLPLRSVPKGRPHPLGKVLSGAEGLNLSPTGTRL